jgi:hypothetical protein
MPVRASTLFRGIGHRRQTKKAADPRRIDVREPYESRLLVKKVPLFKRRAADAVRTVGTNAEDVAIDLGKSYPAPTASSYASYRGH